MTHLCLHHGAGPTVATDELVIPAAQVPAFDDALALAAHLQQLCADASARVQRAEDEARARGFETGRAEGLALAQRRAAEQLARTVAQVDTVVQQQWQALDAAVIDLALGVVRRLAAGLAREDVLAALLRQSLDHLCSDPGPAQGPGRAPAIQVRLHPDMLAAVRERSGCAAPANVDWRADDNLQPLDMVIETATGRLLAGLPTQLARVEQVLRAAPAPAPLRPAAQDTVQDKAQDTAQDTAQEQA